MSALATEDYIAIQQLYARYNHAIDSGNGEAWASTFTPDGTFSSGPANPAGTEALSAFATAFAQRMKARHWINNLVIEPAEGGATGSCYLMLLRLAKEDKPTSMATTAIYHDTLTKAGGEWKFATRTVQGDV